MVTHAFFPISILKPTLKTLKMSPNIKGQFGVVQGHKQGTFKNCPLKYLGGGGGCAVFRWGFSVRFSKMHLRCGIFRGRFFLGGGAFFVQF